ncbi:MAG: S8 family serine peptidase [bacterium]
MADRSSKNILIIACWSFVAIVLSFTVLHSIAWAVYTGSADTGKTASGNRIAGSSSEILYRENEVLVKCKKGMTSADLNNAAAHCEAQVVKEFKNVSQVMNQIYALIRSGNRSTTELVNELGNDPCIEAVSPNYMVSIADTIPNDPFFNQLWGLQNTGQIVNGTAGTPGADISAPLAWDINTGSSTVVVANIDTGVDYLHADLAPNMWHNVNEIPGNGIDDDSNGYVDDVYGINAIIDSGDPMDDEGHGTHTAGTTAAVGNNNIGITGVSWSSQIMALKFLDNIGSGATSDAIKCMDYVILMKNNGVNVVAINASWGGSGFNQMLKDSIEAAGNLGIVFCAAAGNDGTDNDLFPQYPASYDSPTIIAVAATDQNDIKASFSNYGLVSVDLAAPGTNIYSTVSAPTYFPPAVGDLFFDNMEMGNGNWNMTPPEGTWAITTEQSHSPTHAWSDSPGGNYVDNTDASIYTNNINLTAASGNVQLGYWAKLDLEEDFDFLYIEFSGDGGATWTTESRLTGHSDWTLYNITISQYLWTSQFRVRFRLITDLSVTFDGVYIDDVGIGISSGPSNSYAYFNGTSQATPHVTGAVALLAAQYPGDSISQRINRILSGVDVLPGLTGLVATSGRLNLANSIVSPPIIDFSGTPTSGAAPLTVTFTATNTGGPVITWAWNFGDGGTSALQNPTHIYTTPGTYTVSLTANGPGGTDTETKTGYITVYAPPVIDFSGAPRSGAAPLAVAFTATNSGGPVNTWLWDFGDGATSNQMNPAHTYTSEGTYTVSLTATGPGGTDAETKTGYVIVSSLAGEWIYLCQSRFGRRWLLRGLFRVSNVGSENVGSFDVAFYLSDNGTDLGTLLRETTIWRGLRAGMSRSLPFFYLSQTSLSGKYIIAVIDGKTRVAKPIP